MELLHLPGLESDQWCLSVEHDSAVVGGMTHDTRSTGLLAKFTSSLIGTRNIFLGCFSSDGDGAVRNCVDGGFVTRYDDSDTRAVAVAKPTASKALALKFWTSVIAIPSIDASGYCIPDEICFAVTV